MLQLDFPGGRAYPGQVAAAKTRARIRTSEGRASPAGWAGRLLPVLVVLTLAFEISPAAALPGPAPKPSQEPASSPRPPLEDLLAKAAAYCRRLEDSAFDFVCREEIRETLDPKLDLAAERRASYEPDPVPMTIFAGPTISFRTVKKLKHSVVYDYQCVRGGRAIREMRTMLEENGKKKVVPNAALKTSIVVFGRALLGPVGLFGERFQPDYDFTVSGAERFGKIPVVVIDAKPKPGAPPSRNLYGQAWIDPRSGDILRIEWSESRVGRHEIFDKRGDLFKRTPRLIIRSEFSAEKNGIRFPSRLTVEEAYLNKDSGKAFIRSTTEVVYKDFKFFRVEYEVRD
jgi:hypothetical protein